MQATFALAQNQFVTLRLDEASVNGYGAPVAPRLLLQPSLDVAFPSIGPARKIEFLRLSARLEFENQLFLDAIPVSLSLSVSSSHPIFPNFLVSLEFPMTQAIVTIIEKQRNGGNIRARFWATLEFQDLRQSGGNIPNETWLLAGRHVQSNGSQVEFLSSAWISRVLPNIGYGIVHVVEFPAVPLEQFAGFHEAFKALGQARERHLTGLYDDAAAKCRVALERFFESVEILVEGEPPKRIPKLKASWEKRLGKATYEWLNSSLSTVKDATNRSHHSPNEHFDQLESQLLIAITTALVAYAARTATDGNLNAL